MNVIEHPTPWHVRKPLDKKYWSSAIVTTRGLTSDYSQHFVVPLGVLSHEEATKVVSAVNQFASLETG